MQTNLYFNRFEQISTSDDEFTSLCTFLHLDSNVKDVLSSSQSTLNQYTSEGKGIP